MSRPPISSRGANQSSWGKPPPTASARFNPLENQNLARPITQQGIGLKTSHGGGGGQTSRSIQDKSYFIGELKSRIGLVSTEMDRLTNDNIRLEGESANFMTFEKRSQGLSLELEELQGQLGDLNLMFECLQKDRDLEDLVREANKLKQENDVQAKKVEEFFFQRQKKEKIVHDLEKQLMNERAKTELLIEKLAPEERQKYLDIKEENENLLRELSEVQNQLQESEELETSLAKKIESSSSKKRFVDLLTKLDELKRVKHGIEEQGKASLDDDEEREKLLQQVKEDNQEISVLDKKIAEAEEQLETLQKLIKQNDEQQSQQKGSNSSINLTGNNIGDKSEKIDELLKRDREINIFLNEYVERKVDLEEKLKKYEGNIAESVEMLGKLQEELSGIFVLSHESGSGLAANGEEQQAAIKAKLKGMEVEELEKELEQRTKEVERLLATELRTKKDLEATDANIAALRNELKEFENIDQVKKEIEKQHHDNVKNRENLKKQRDQLQHKVNEGFQHLEEQKTSFEENDTYTHLVSMESKIRHQEANLFHLKTEMDMKSRDCDVLSIEQDLKREMDEYNGILLKRVMAV